MPSETTVKTRRRGWLWAGLWVLTGVVGILIGSLLRPDPLTAFLGLLPFQLGFSLLTAPLFTLQLTRRD